MGLLPFVTKPVELHSYRDMEDMCELKPAQCAYLSEHWHNWYQADHVYSYNTIYFMVAFIGVFGLSNVARRFIKPAESSNPAVQRIVAVLRYLSYRGYLFRPFNWTSPSLGVLIMGAAGFVYFTGLTLGPKPYYWSNPDFGSSPPLATRTGWMSLALLPFILILSSKANMITTVTGVPHEKLQVFHRWSAYAMFILALLHTFPFIVNNIHYGTMEASWKTSIVYWSGVAALIPQAYLTFFSVGPLRNRFYEFFKATHYFVALVFIFFLFLHCDHTLSSWDYFIAAGSLYLASLLYSQIRTYLGYGMRHAYLSTISGTYIQAVIPMTAAQSAKAAIPIGVQWKPGQHIFVRFLERGLNHISGHPFTICSLCPTSDAKVPQLRLIIRPHGGLTASLAKLAHDQPSKPISVYLDGPYGGPRSGSLSSKVDKLFIIAGGSGAGFTLPLIEDAIRMNLTSDAEKGGKLATINVVLATRVPETPDWYKSEILGLLETYNSSVPITVSIHVTGSAASNLDTKAVPDADPASESSNSSTKSVRGCFRNQIGRPNLPETILEAASEKGISLALAVCGPVSMLNDVRNAAADAQRMVLSANGARGVYLHSERFGW